VAGGNDTGTVPSSNSIEGDGDAWVTGQGGEDVPVGETGLYYNINYRGFNIIIIKNCYLLLLIIETLNHLN